MWFKIDIYQGAEPFLLQNPVTFLYLPIFDFYSTPQEHILSNLFLYYY